MPEAHKQAEIDARPDDFMDLESRKPFGYPARSWIKWATIIDTFQRLGIEPGAKVLDLGCGAGWTSNFLAESGYSVTGIDVVPGNIAAATKRARTRGLSTTFIAGDMDKFSFKERFDAVLIFDSLHHSTRQSEVIKRIAKHLKPGGWVIFGEPSLLHTISPEARRTTREQGIIERGITMHSLRRDSKKAGLSNFRRFFEATRPYESRFFGFSWQLIKLISANFIFAPQTSLWLAAQKPVKK